MSYYSSSSRYTSSSGRYGDSSFSRSSPGYRSFGGYSSGSSRRYSGGYSSGGYSSGGYSSGGYSGGLSSGFYSSFRRNSTISSNRHRYPAGSHKPVYDSFWWKDTHYADDNDVITREKGKGMIQVDFLKTENRKAHQTSMYGVKSLIVRRGKEFKLEIQLQKQFDKTKDRLELLFSKGERPQESKGTLIRLKLTDSEAAASKQKSHGWLGYISSVNGSSGGSRVGVTVKPHAEALVGKYGVKSKLFAEYEKKDSKRYIKDEDEELYLLFNPWCKDDQVYMENKQLIDEYIMNETGRIWVGSARQNHGRPWNFGQFSKHSLDGALYLLERSKTLKEQGHGNATLVCRTLSAMANSNDDNGVLEGNWSGNYHGGTSPTSWNGSQAIMEQYMLTKRPVKYGQCWVFSGVLTTLGRTLGIPTRSVTNFESAHDHDFSMTIDSHYNEDCSPLPAMDDSVWNFHVWNESWFKRPDLPDGYDGWQAYDATPQEASEGIFRCGPAPIKAIKEGNVYLGYDTKFVFAEVNGDRIDWVVSPTGMYVSSVDPHSVGKSISTKKPGSSQVDDVTHDYKHPEGSEKEREAVVNASKYSSRSDKLDSVYADTEKHVEFKYDSRVERNGNIGLTVGVRNTSAVRRSIEMKITATAAYYTGIPGDELTQEVIKVEVDPEERKDQTWFLPAASYLNLISEDAKVKLYIMAKVKGTNQVFTKSEIFEIEKPELNLQTTTSSPKVGHKFEVTITMTNPVEVPLTDGVIRLEGPGIQKNMKIHVHKSVNPGQTITEKATLIAKYPGKREIIACFNCKQLSDVTGAHEIQVAE